MARAKSTPADETPEAEKAAGDRTGEFVGLGVKHQSTQDGEWKVDPDTGCITGKA